MTCNHDAPKAHRRLGFKIESGEEDEREIILKNELTTLFKNEFLSRVDQVVLFEQLSHEDYGRLFDRHAGELIRLLASDYGITLHIDEVVKSEICEIAIARGEGARGLARVFNQRLVTVVMEHPEEAQGTTINVSWDNGVVLSSG